MTDRPDSLAVRLVTGLLTVVYVVVIVVPFGLVLTLLEKEEKHD